MMVAQASSLWSDRQDACPTFLWFSFCSSPFNENNKKLFIQTMHLNTSLIAQGFELDGDVARRERKMIACDYGRE